ncbi:MAG: HAMP domain-containing sensor histidine kinase [Firmicutes bacterium]|nr:HAMP domain-containing sensor histidine kinase [Bacillota bacterium]MDY6159644.1 HAMP domain-containing sensor histidine kinase [Candidatus Faecousia sp.]
MTIWGYGIIAASLLLAAGSIFWYRRRSGRLLENLNRMLDLAMAGNFTEGSFDETMLSALESKLAHYLAASTVSAQNVQAEKEKLKALIGDISHQTKTPISNILLYTQLLSEQPENRDCLEALDAQARKLQSLIDALVKTSRLESGVIALHPVPGELQKTIRAALSQIAPKAAAKGIPITLEPADAQAIFDPKWTEEAIYNLLDNAVKYTQGEVCITATENPLFSAVHIRDTGPGIPEEEQAKVFQRFYRGTEHAEEEGVGIGLYLVRQIAQGQGGYVKVRSQVGVGSTFSLYLPRM